MSLEQRLIRRNRSSPLQYRQNQSPRRNRSPPQYRQNRSLRRNRSPLQYSRSRSPRRYSPQRSRYLSSLFIRQRLYSLFTRRRRTR